MDFCRGLLFLHVFVQYHSPNHAKFSNMTLKVMIDGNFCPKKGTKAISSLSIKVSRKQLNPSLILVRVQGTFINESYKLQKY